MNGTVNDLRELLEARDLHGFLLLYADQGTRAAGQPGAGMCTQRVLPLVLREMFASNRVEAKSLVLLWNLVRGGRLLVVENDLLQAINERVDQAFHELDGPDAPAAPKLLLYEDKPLATNPSSSAPLSTQNRSAEAIPMKRIVIASAYQMGRMDASDAFSFKKNLCASSQEGEFLRAVRQFFPSLRAYPNLPLRNFIDLDALGPLADESMRRYCWGSQVDVLLCTEDEDPVAGIELDSVHHDNEATQERDMLKNRLFKLAAIPLIRIRPANTANARAEDFYDLLMAEADSLDALRPRRLRPRRNHDMLVPAETYVRRFDGVAAGR